MHIIYGDTSPELTRISSAVLTSVVAACQISVLSEIPENLSGLGHCCSAFAKRTVRLGKEREQDEHFERLNSRQRYNTVVVDALRS